MMKLKNALTKECQAKEKQNQKEDAVRRKYNVPDADGTLMVIDGSFLRIVKTVIRWIFTILVFLMCAAGVLALIYPQTRSGILAILQVCANTIGIPLHFIS